ncbi:PREDICTED: CASP-like protein 2C1 isoform X1 [Nicotiana attenuata]|uniref:CASP-like protein n=1 Tax=Nicotiana attenuata TaxID=49451 RepID=A0A1J6KPQ8_NICAT|nr:PREDICTED: CASP-like protein 2C1 isoform X1 [Nicotiana attenuata]OIT26840.1 casp-like protein 2c1 [Nicotiana attenuata]
MDIVRKEGLLRLFAIVFLVLTACLMGFDSQTKLLFDTIERKASFKDLDALFVLVWIDVAVASYSVLQVLRCFLIPTTSKGDIRQRSYKNYWLFFFLDQAAVYTVFAAQSAAIEASAIALVGVRSLQWMKICNRYTRFCIQIGGALLCGYAAVLVLVVVSSLSAFQLFRLYSPKKFLQLKGKLNDDHLLSM